MKCPTRKARPDFALIAKMALLAGEKSGAPGWNRTSDTRFRKPVLYPLSYEGIVPICRGFSSAAAGPEYQSCEKVAKSAGNVRARRTRPRARHGLGEDAPDRLAVRRPRAAYRARRRVPTACDVAPDTDDRGRRSPSRCALSVSVGTDTSCEFSRRVNQTRSKHSHIWFGDALGTRCSMNIHRTPRDRRQ